MYKNPQFRQDLFKGTSNYYSKYRPSYNSKMIEEIINSVSIEQDDILLDLACGPGRLTIPLSKYFKKVFANDWEKEMIEEGEKISKKLEIENIEWICCKAEECIFTPNTLKLITIGDAFHRMDQLKILKNSYKMLKIGGCIALLSSVTVTRGDYEWQEELRKILLLHDKRDNEERKKENSTQPWDLYLNETGYINVFSNIYTDIISLSIDEIIGYLYSMSVYSKTVIGDDYEIFENRIKDKLLKIKPDNKFEFNYRCAYYLGKK
jgi:ubiquinone/menaquinone biosynthesis C-methylase UbiE